MTDEAGNLRMNLIVMGKYRRRRAIPGGTYQRFHFVGFSGIQFRRLQICKVLSGIIMRGNGNPEIAEEENSKENHNEHSPALGHHRVPFGSNLFFP